MATEPTAEDLTLDPAKLLAVCEDRLRHDWHDLPITASAPRTIAALCRRLLFAEAEVLRLRARLKQVEETARPFAIAFSATAARSDWLADQPLLCGTGIPLTRGDATRLKEVLDDAD